MNSNRVKANLLVLQQLLRLHSQPKRMQQRNKPKVIWLTTSKALEKNP